MTQPTEDKGAEMVCVPREPTPAQLELGRNRTALFNIGAVYRDMLAVARTSEYVAVPISKLRAWRRQMAGFGPRPFADEMAEIDALLSTSPPPAKEIER